MARTCRLLVGVGSSTRLGLAGVREIDKVRTCRLLSATEIALYGVPLLNTMEHFLMRVTGRCISSD